MGHSNKSPSQGKALPCTLTSAVCARSHQGGDDVAKMTKKDQSNKLAHYCCAFSRKNRLTSAVCARSHQGGDDVAAVPKKDQSNKQAKPKTKPAEEEPMAKAPKKKATAQPSKKRQVGDDVLVYSC